ncbi:MAG: hypothetical protein INQ03_05545 [Candidatus Heimdallarchaeota archaeon]|nr:hypothetical protein [Candidatus Heimdallarchaeota archaeon]
MVNDKIYGAIMAGIGAVGIALETYFLIFHPLLQPNVLPDGFEPLWWAVAIPIFIGVLGVLGIVVWIGLTMIRTPPPEAWSFDEVEEETKPEEES